MLFSIEDWGKGRILNYKKANTLRLVMEYCVMFLLVNVISFIRFIFFDRTFVYYLFSKRPRDTKYAVIN